MRLYRFHSIHEIDNHNHVRAENRALDRLLAELEHMHTRMAELVEQSLAAQQVAA